MMKSKLLFPLVSMLLLAACTSRPTGGAFGDEVTLVASDTANFVIDDSTYYESKAMFQFEDKGREYLYFQTSKDRGTLKIIIYDIETGSVHKTVPLYREGPNGIPNPFGGYPLSMDRFLITPFAPYIYMVDGNGKRVFRSDPLRKPKDGFKDFCGTHIYSYYASPAILRDSLLYFAQTNIGYPHTKDTWKTSNIFACVDLQTGKLGTTNFCYPSVFDGEEITRQISYDCSHSFADTGKEVAVSFDQTDSIYVSSDFDHVRAYDARSRYAPSVRPKPYKAYLDVDIWLRSRNRQHTYHHLLYDKYRKVFYRFAMMPYEFPSGETPRGEDKGREFSIVILNDKYEIIGETRFPGNTYNYRMCFVGKKGLYLSLNNQGNPDFSEDVLSMVCFTLADVER